MKNIIFHITIFLFTIATTANAAIGQWNTYMAYSEITDIEPAGNIIYVLSSGSLFSYNVNDQSVSVYNKVYPLNDTDITHIAWCSSAKQLVIIYSNQNIDLLDNNGNVTNISDYYNKSMTEDKTVNNITIGGNHAYLSTGFGIIKINVKDAEISDTYNLGMNVTDCAIDSNNIYAKTSTGIYAGKTSDNLLDKSNWNITSASVSFNDANDVTVSTANGYTEYIAYDSSNKCYWSNQSDGKLQGYKLGNDNVKTVIAQNINPEGPKYNYFGFMKFHNEKLYSCGGTDWDQGKNACIQVLNDKEWTIFQDEGITEQTGVTYRDIMCIDINPNNEHIVAAGARNGLYIFDNGKFSKFYNDENSLIESYDKRNKEYELISGIKFDNEGNIWCLNTQAPTQSLLQLTTDGEWISHSKSDLMKLDDTKESGFKDKSLGCLQGMIIDSRGLLWFVNNHYTIPSAYCYQISTDALNTYDKFTNEDGTTLSIQYVRCVAEDNNKNMWIGTNVGPIVLKAGNVGASPDEILFDQIKIPRNDGTNYADYLLSGVDITAIAIDGGNRKWFGTNGNGVYLISDDNMTEIHHFTTNNSSLLSNNIQSIAINNNTGEVFIGTDKGLCSYMSDASMPNEDMNKDNVYAYPNPVRPDYTGLITIIGLSYNADIKITTVNGTLVAQGRSNGGTFTWDGNDLNGKRVASGIYMVQTATSNGSKGTVCKIAVIN